MGLSVVVPLLAIVVAAGAAGVAGASASGAGASGRSAIAAFGLLHVARLLGVFAIGAGWGVAWVVWPSLKSSSHLEAFITLILVIVATWYLGLEVLGWVFLVRGLSRLLPAEPAEPAD
jgi:hypothetical protein